jgi:hypothetical protein
LVALWQNCKNQLPAPTITFWSDSVLEIASEPAFRSLTGAEFMKKPTPDLKQRMCTGKRRYRTQGDALDAAMLVGVERQRTAYRCKICGHWHLASR